MAAGAAASPLAFSLPSAGSSVFIAAHTLYSFRAGPDGVRFLNFRPVGGARYIFKDEFMEATTDLWDIPPEQALDAA